MVLRLSGQLPMLVNVVAHPCIEARIGLDLAISGDGRSTDGASKQHADADLDLRQIECSRTIVGLERSVVVRDPFKAFADIGDDVFLTAYGRRCS